MQARDTLGIKVTFKPEDIIRRGRMDIDITLDQFFELANQLQQDTIFDHQKKNECSFSAADRIVTYLDNDNDWVTIGSEQEWRDALQEQYERAVRTENHHIMRITLTETSGRSLSIEQQQQRPDYLNKFLDQANTWVKQVQREIDADEHVKMGREWVNEAKDELTQAWRELLDRLFSAATTGIQSYSVPCSSSCTQTQQQPPRQKQTKITEYSVKVPTQTSVSVQVPEKRAEEEEEREIVVHPLAGIPTPSTIDQDSSSSIIMMDEQPTSSSSDSCGELVVQELWEPDYKYAESLESLIAMGFNNVELNKKLLEKRKGDLSKVVADLLK